MVDSFSAYWYGPEPIERLSHGLSRPAGNIQKLFTAMAGEHIERQEAKRACLRAVRDAGA